MACMKLVSRADAFQRQGQAWFCTTGLPSDVTIEVDEMFFHLHKFPLIAKSGLLERLIREISDEGEDCSLIKLPDMPGGSKAFELVAKFAYGVKLELTPSNVTQLHCIAQHLEMTDEIAENNLISQTENYLIQVIFHSWKDCIQTLHTCDDVLPYAEDLQIVKRCVDSLAAMACTDPRLFGWPIMEHNSIQSPGGSVLWNGISTGARPRSRSGWWYEDVSSLSFPMYKRLISVMESRGMGQEIITGSLAIYAKRHLPGLNRRQSISRTSTYLEPRVSTVILTEEEQKHLIEELDRLLPLQKGVVSAKLLLDLLRTAMILRVSSSCKLNLERRIGMQLDEATLEDLLIPTFSDTMETLYDVDCVQRIVEHFLAIDQANNGASPDVGNDDRSIGSPGLMPITTVARLIDGYLAEVASDANLKLPKFYSLADSIPDYARPLDDGLYRAIDMFLKTHHWLTESEREELCRLMDCQKLSLEACTHATQNDRLPLRVVVQVLFFEQLQLRTSIAGCYLMSDAIDASRSGLALTNDDFGCPPAVSENQILKVGMESMRTRVLELEKECSSMRGEIDKLTKEKSPWSAWSFVRKKFGSSMKPQMCSANDGGHFSENDKVEHVKKMHLKLAKYS